MNMILSKLKRGIATALAFVFAISIFGGFTFTTEVQAANTYNLKGDFNSSLTYNKANQYPTESSITSTENKDLLLKWNYTNTVQNQLVSVPIDDDKILNAQVENIDGDDTIDFSLFYTTQDGTPIFVPASSYKIYYPPEDSFILYATSLTSYNNNTHAKIEVSDVSNSTVSNAKFSLKENTGFSILYNGKGYRFLWSNGQLKLYIVDEILEGYIYDVSMNGEIQSYYTRGINTSTMTSEPYGNTLLYMYDKVIHDSTTGPWPADDVVGLDITFDMPKWYDPTAKTFSSTHSDKINNINIQFYIGAETSSQSFTFRLNDILNGATVDSTISKSGTTATVNSSKVTVKIPNLKAGVVYTNNSVYMNCSDSSTNIIFKKQEIPSSVSIYTFPKYKVIQYGGSLYLSITPFVNENNEKLLGAYVLYANMMADKSAPSINQYRNGFESLVKVNYDPETGKEVISLPLTIQPVAEGEDPEATAREYYIEFNLNQTASTVSDTSIKYYSQPLYYEPEIDTSVVGVPEKFTVESYNLSAKYENGVRVEGQSNLELNTSWIISKKSNLDKKMTDLGGSVDINYSLDSSLTQDLKGDWDEEANITLTVTSGSPVTVAVKDNLKNGLYTIQGTPKIVEEVIGNETYYRVYVNYIFDAGTEDIADTLKEFEYPNIYFLALNYLETDTYGEINKYTSTLENITLNDESFIEVPTASDVDTSNVIVTLKEDGDDEDRSSFDLTWKTVGSDVYSYLKSIYTDEELATAELDVYYNIYFSQKEDDFKDTFYNKSYSERVYSSSNTTGQAVPYAYSSLLKPSATVQNRILFNNINGDTISASTKPIDVIRNTSSSRPYVVVEKYPLSSDVIESFKTSQSATIENTLTIDGLDLNTKYYGFIETVVYHNGLKVTLNGTQKNLTEYSKPSLIFAETTKSELPTPEPSDVDPQAPVVTVKEVNIKDATFLIAPYVLADLEGYTQTLQYEVLKLESVKLNDAYLNNKSVISNFLTTYTSDVALKSGYRITDDEVEKFNVSTNAYASTTEATASIDNTGTSFNDTSLNSNKVYYYYFRSVKTVKDTADTTDTGVTTYSSWIPLNITTSTIQPPKNLSVKQDETFDAQTQVPILFYGMISDVSTLGVNDFFEISYKQGDGEWTDPYRMDSNTLKKSAGVLGDDGYRSFLYTVNGLQPGQTYYFRIRHVLADGTVSIYSEILRWKTEVGDDYEDETDIDNWNDYIKDILEELMNTNEWILNDNSSLYELVYRTDKWENQLDRLVGKTWKMKDMNSDRVNTFYIPGDIYEDVLSKKLNLESKYENVTFNFKNAFVDNNTQAMINMKKTLQGKDVSDYYLKITVSPQNTTEKINGEAPLTDKLVVDMELVAFTQGAPAWEDQIEAYVTEQLLAKFENHDIKDDIEKAVEGGELSPEILSMIEEFRAEMLDDAYEYIEKSFDETVLTSATEGISNYSGTVSLTATKGDVDKAKGLLLNGTSYVAQKTTENSTTSTMNASKDGTYIFTGLSYNITTNTDTETKDLISDFNLYDVLSSEGTLDTEAELTNSMLAQVYANLTGKTYDDSTTALSKLGVNINDRNKNRGATNAQTIGAIMNIYEAKSGQSISSYKITNYVTYTELKNALTSESLAKAVYVAKDIGIYSGSNYSGVTTVGETLDMLRALQKAIGY
ncbi:MAG: hypothetical protein ACK5LY_10685 [Lachnospirales bacterium]